MYNIYIYLYIRILPTHVDPNGKDKYEPSFAHQAISTNFPMINDDHPINPIFQVSSMPTTGRTGPQHL